ncbi:LPS export ABC transporter permease LptG [Dyella sp.]|jgi:lipopolysaccharide export system permease protein|uniref:LPS export ABC transporter permease LptG n=1 Tax=Dyella sp. TaxID=1869338 RepID=UPI002D79651F|nr:LPS export ABC transporter permease LptG [Dyella sp.]HET6431710.1 LPS export ABC transporter permease LptG [Dyella sp.]
MSPMRVRRVDWLIGTTVLGALLTVWFLIAGLDAVLQFLRQLGHVGKNGFTVTDAALYVLVTFPRRLYENFGYATVIGGLLGLGGLAGSGELTALRAAGMSQLRIAASAAGVVAVLIVGVVILGETAAPWGDQQAQAMQLRQKGGAVGMAGSSGLWARDGNRVINAKASLLKEVKGHNQVELADVRVFTFADDGELTRLDWARGAQHDGRHWTLTGVRTTTLDAAGTHTTTAASAPWDAKLNPRVLEQSLVQPQYLPMRDLRRNIRYLESNGQSPGVYAVAFWTRALYPLNVLVLVLCAMPFAFGSLRSGGLGKRIFIGILIAIAWYFLQQAMINFGTVYGVPPLLANLLPATVLAIAAWFYFRRHR